MKKNALKILLIAFTSLLPFQALAATRTVYFDQTTHNMTQHGLAAPTPQSVCTITINNPSNYSQTVSMKVYASVRQTSSMAYAVMIGSPTGLSMPTAGEFTLTPQILTAGSNLKYEFKYPGPAVGVKAEQWPFCRGSITVDDTTPSTPGFLAASGLLLSWSESSVIQTSGSSTSSGTAYAGNIVYTQVPISINRGKPF